MVYARKHGSKTLTFQVSGMLWRNSLIMQDRETGTNWSQVTGDAIRGPLKGQELQQIPAEQTTWAQWLEAHPETKVLKKDATVTASHYQKYFDDPEKTGLFRSRWLVEKMPGKAKVYGMTIGPHALAVTPESLDRGGVIQASLGETPVVVTRPKSGGVVAWQAKMTDRLRFVPEKERPGRYLDRATSSVWDLDTGRCTDGKLIGVQLEPVPLTEVFWFAWSSFYPNTQVVD